MSKSMKYENKIIALALVLVSLGGLFTPAWAGRGYMGGRQPYGGYCMGPRFGWYGAKQPVKTMEQARKQFEKFFEGADVSIGKITDGGLFFKAEIKNTKNAVIDYVIIDKRTGRIRSTF
jgi:hypothetical protein